MTIQIGEMTLDCSALRKLVKTYRNEICKSIKDDYYDNFLDDDYDSFEMYLLDAEDADEVYSMRFLNCYCNNNYGKSYDDIYAEHKSELDEFILDKIYCKLNDIMPKIIAMDKYMAA